MINEIQLEKLPVDEKLRLVTSLWDQIARSGQTISLPPAVLDDANHRIDEMTSDDTACLTEDEMWRQSNELR